MKTTLFILSYLFFPFATFFGQTTKDADKFEGNYVHATMPGSFQIDVADLADYSLFNITKKSDEEYQVGDNLSKDVYKKVGEKLVREIFTGKTTYFFYYEKKLRKEYLVAQYDDLPVERKDYYSKSSKPLRE